MQTTSFIFFVYFTDPEPCKRLGLECVSCSQCGENGFCITNLDLRNSNMVCLCRYGFTGNQAKFVPQRLETTTYTKNRIRADSCDVKCNYSPHNRYKMFFPFIHSFVRSLTCSACSFVCSLTLNCFFDVCYLFSIFQYFSHPFKLSSGTTNV